jgi:hypothetical protein
LTPSSAGGASGLTADVTGMIADFLLGLLLDRSHGRPRATLLLLVLCLLIGGLMIAPGVWLIVQRQTGTRAMAKVEDCDVVGSGEYRNVYCTGSWTVGGSLLEGGHVVVGKIDGVDDDAVGKTIDVTVRGDTAYSRGLIVPSILIGAGVGWSLLVIPLWRTRVRSPQQAQA